MTWPEIGRAVPAYTIAGGRPLRGRGVSIFPEPVMEGGWLGQTWIERRELDINVCAKIRLHGLGGENEVDEEIGLKAAEGAAAKS
ncbi:uncharacterized protein LACBIDRAFT_304704 [Laccaria bicolor S238N-H82]|uniref:Predicted protein n=1 Tax=Laccaria bicolor (strain S238N-H82 / ATCC MYA-4686) TaxID=486041 RepID=B0E4F2_LACBS|nr:uncharacterized protein LACBIDRAFT_304704 [Laccaria bicolor S238N-H82]EDQ98277.1 predicted protein [Laccaria bicolor S238N-H82]|eukprot:XP_001891070.1 predicted protein [Laccaria bicolor S238N-H82]